MCRKVVKLIATLRTAIQITDGMTPAFRSMNNALNIVVNSFETLQHATNNPIHTESIHAARAELARTEITLNQVEAEIRQANQQQQNFNASMRTGSVEASNLGQKVMGFVTALAGAAGVVKIGNMTDEYASQGARLAMINDGTQTQLELQRKIFQAAENSRGVYGDTVATVAKLGLLAKDAFSTNDETIKFAELMNKSFRVSGASAQEASSGMYQLTQALAAGKLQGDEFRSVMENAPMVAQAIAKFTGKSMGELKEMSSEGTITADIIKNAMFMAADDINAKFETMPKTFGSVWTSMKNQAIMEFSETMQKVNDYLNSADGTVMVDGITNSMKAMTSVLGSVIGAVMILTTFMSANWDIITPIIWGLVAAFGAYNAVLIITNGINAVMAIMEATKAAAQMLSTGATFAATAAQHGLNAALYACPITWIILAIIALVVVFYVAVAAVNHFAGTSLSATGIIAGAFMVALAFVGNLFVGFFNLVIDIFGLTQNFIASFAEFFANVFNDPIGSIVRLFSSMADNILSIISGIASAMDTLFGSNLAGAVDGWRDQLQAMTNDLVGEAKIKVDRVDPDALHLDRFEYGKAFENGNNFGKNVESKLDFASMFGGSTDAAESLKQATETAANTGAMKDSMKSSDEDLKYLRDIAEKEAVNRFTTAEIKVDMVNHNNVSSDMDLDGVVSYLEEKVYETMTIAGEGVHS